MSDSDDGSSGAAEEEVDPLDAFMADVQHTVKVGVRRKYLPSGVGTGEMRGGGGGGCTRVLSKVNMI